MSVPSFTTGPAAGADIDVSARRLVSIAWPLVLHGLVTVVVASNDVVLLGSQGARVVASAVVASALLTVLVTSLSAFAVGTQIEASRARGAGDDELARDVVAATYRLVVVLALPLVVVAWVLAPVLTGWLGGAAADADLAADYLRITLLGVPPALLGSVLRAYATSIGRTRVVLVAGLFSAGTDVAVSLTLVTAIGWRGVAIGTVVGYAVSALAFTVWRQGLPVEVRPRWLAEGTGGLERRLLSLGWPESLLALFSTASGIVVVVVLADSTPEVLAAARNLDVQLMLAWVVLYSIGAAQLSLLGEALGAGRSDLVQQARRTAGVVMGGTAVLLFVLAAPWSGLLLDLAAGRGVAEAAGGWGWLAWGQVGWQAACAAYVSTCRALRDTRASLVASLVGEYAVFLPLGLVLCRWWDLDVLGVVLCHHAFWMTFVVIVVWRARAALARELPTPAPAAG